MFEKIVLRRSETGNAVTAGQLAEALLFYQNVHLVIDMGSFGALVRQIGAGTLLSLLQRTDCTAVYCEESLGTHSQAIGPLQAHSYIAFSLVGHDGIGELKSREERVAYMLRNAGVSDGEAKRFAQAFLKAAAPRKLSGDFFLKGGITSAARQDLNDSSFVRAAVNKALELTPGAAGLGASLRFDIQDSDLGMYVFHNIDFPAINARRGALRPPQEPTTSAHLLSHILEARADLALASFYGGDFISSEVTSSIVQLRYSEILRRGELNEEQQSQFHQVTLTDYPTLRETIDSGQRTFKDFLLLLDKASRFKEWLKAASVDQGLVRSYMTEISKEGWIQSVPAKTVRYLFTTALEAHNPLVGTAAAIADNFIIEKLLGGWRPNHFVENRLGPFLQPWCTAAPIGTSQRVKPLLHVESPRLKYSPVRSGNETENRPPLYRRPCCTERRRRWRTDPDANRLAELHSHRVGLARRSHQGLVKLARCRSDLFSASSASRRAWKPVRGSGWRYRLDFLSLRRPAP